MVKTTNPGAIDEYAIIGKVFDTADIDVKTELNEKQIERINKLRTLSTISGSHILAEHIENYMRLRKSLGRKSMHELVNSIIAKKEQIIKKSQNVMSRLSEFITG